MSFMTPAEDYVGEDEEHMLVSKPAVSSSLKTTLSGFMADNFPKQSLPKLQKIMKGRSRSDLSLRRPRQEELADQNCGSDAEPLIKVHSMKKFLEGKVGAISGTWVAQAPVADGGGDIHVGRRWVPRVSQERSESPDRLGQYQSQDKVIDVQARGACPYLLEKQPGNVSFLVVGYTEGPLIGIPQVKVGDLLVCINGETCDGLSQSEMDAKLKALANDSRQAYYLTFKRHSNSGSLGERVGEALDFIQLNKERFFRPISRSEGLTLGYVERLRGDKVTAFHLHRQDTGEFILACSCKADMTGPFIFHTSQNSHLRTMKELLQLPGSATYLGSMSENFLGTEFAIQDHRSGYNPKTEERTDIAVIIYQRNVLGRCPNALKLILPRESDQAKRRVYVPARLRDERRRRTTSHVLRKFRSLTLNDMRTFAKAVTSSSRDFAVTTGSEASSSTFDDVLKSTTAECIKHYDAVVQNESEELFIFQTRKPTWNSDLRAWTLNFGGRVKQASKKNFLISGEEGNSRMEEEFGTDDIVFRFGKVNKNKFSCDFSYPFSPVVALGTAVTSFADKLIVT